VLLAVACNLQSAPVANPDQVATAVAQTIEAQQTQTAAAVAPSETSAPAPETSEPEVTPTEALTDTPVATATPAVPMVSVTTNTNCRTGPGAIYDYLGALLVGESAEVVARSTGGNYWYIVNPDNPSQFCWLWGEYAQVVGNTAVLPAFTPPPSPTPTYTPTPTHTPTPTP
jgi:uncharacterized protein YgiM (DUF1202 family)